MFVVAALLRPFVAQKCCVLAFAWLVRDCSQVASAVVDEHLACVDRSACSALHACFEDSAFELEEVSSASDCHRSVR